jgi:transcription antitermination factor NusG
VARAKPHKEQHAAAVLQQRGIDVYLPQLRKRRPRPGRPTTEFLFPCYLFGFLNARSDQWLAARSAPDIAYFLCADGQPIPLPDNFVAALKVRVELANRDGGLPHFTRGERVIIRSDQFQHVEAIFDRALNATGRVRVLVQFLNRQVSVDLPEDQIKTAS